MSYFKTINTVQDLIEHCAELGLNKEHFPKDKGLQLRLLSVTQLWGQLPHTIPLDGVEFDKDCSNNVLSKFPAPIRKKVEEALETCTAFFTFVDPTDTWWTGPISFQVDNAYSLSTYWLYKFAQQEEKYREFPLPIKRPIGRPVTEAGTTRKQEKEAQKESYQLWLQQCADHRARLAELKQIYETKFAEAEEARKAWRKLESDGAPPRSL